MPQYAFYLQRRFGPESNPEGSEGLFAGTVRDPAPVVIDLSDDARAVREAIAACGEWLRDVDFGAETGSADVSGFGRGAREGICGPWEMHVIDEDGAALCTIHFVIRCHG